MVDRLVSGDRTDEDRPLDSGLRPRRLSEFQGQVRVKENLAIAIQAAKQRAEALDHLILYGPPGLGKTTLASVIASEMGVNLRVTAGPAIERPGDLAALISNLQHEDLLFIDEMHRLHPAVEEVLYPAMEDFRLSWVMGKGLGARSINLQIPPFTLVGATTRFAMMSAPLRDRFGAVYRMEFYTTDELVDILRRSATLLEVEHEDGGLREMARRARGTPRVANRLLRRVRDFAQVMADGTITRETACDALVRLEIDELGLDQVDYKILRALIEKFNGGPVGLDTIAAAISEDPDTVMDVYEPYLLQLGFLDRTPRGRAATQNAYEHLGVPTPNALEERAGQGRLL